MNDLLEMAIAAHGGLERWHAQRAVCLEASVGGALWDSKDQTGLVETVTYEADTHAQKAVFSGFGAPGRRVRFTPAQLVVEDTAGKAIALRDNPREAFAGHTAETPWDDLHAAYFNGYALWTYLTQPFLYTYPGDRNDGTRALGGSGRNMAPTQGPVSGEYCEPHARADHLLRTGWPHAAPRLRRRCPGRRRGRPVH